MKTLITALFVLIAAYGSLGQSDKSVQVTSVGKVTLYPNGAYMECTVSKFLAKGHQVLRFSGLPAEMDPTTVKVTAGGGVNIQSHSYEQNHLKTASVSAGLRQLKDSLRTYLFDYNFNRNMLEVYEEERKMVLANQKVGWEQGGFVVEDLEDLSDFYRDRLADIMLKSMEIEARQRKVKRNLDRVQQQVSAYGPDTATATSDVVADVFANSNGSASFNLSFFISSAGWEPLYHVQLNDNQLKVSLYAKAFQVSGMDWQNTTLEFAGKVPIGQASSTASAGGEDIFTAGENMSLPSNGVSKSILLKEYALPAYLTYQVNLCEGNEVKKVARVPNASDYDLPSGEAEIFSNEGYSGKSFFDAGTLSDSLQVVLGYEDDVVIEDRPVSRTFKTGKQGREKVEVEIRVRNAKETGVELMVVDPLPEFPKGTALETDVPRGAVFNRAGCKVVWRKSFSPGEMATMRYKYTVKHPGEKKSK